MISDNLLCSIALSVRGRLPTRVCVAARPPPRPLHVMVSFHCYVSCALNSPGTRGASGATVQVGAIHSALPCIAFGLLHGRC